MAGLVVLAVGVTGTVVLAVGDAVVMSVRGKKCHICFLPYIYIYIGKHSSLPLIDTLTNKTTGIQFAH